MKVPSTVIHVEIAKAGEGFLVLLDVHDNDLPAGTVSVKPSGPRVTYLKGREELKAWFDQLEKKV